jgi:predicted hydrocarbon binding protein
MDHTEAPDQPSEATLQLLWKEGDATRSIEFLKRDGVSDGRINRVIVPKNGVQAHWHNHYYDDAFFLHDAERGVLTNPYGQRLMRVSEDYIVAILGALDDVTGTNAAREIMYKCGYQWGLNDMKRFLPRMRAEFEAELDRMRVDFLMESWWWPLTIEGWGTWRFDATQRDKGLLFVELYESTVAQSVGDVGAVLCYFYAGLFAATFSALSRRPLGCVEMQCYGTGEEFCKFVVSDYDRVNAAAFWRNEGATARDIMKKLYAM